MIANFDILPTERIWDYLFPNIPKSYVLNSKFESLGYKNQYLLYNLGTILLSFIAYLIMVPLTFLLRHMSKKFPCLKSMYTLLHYTTFWSYPITLMTESYTSIVMCVMINFLHVSNFVKILDDLVNWWWNYEFFIDYRIFVASFIYPRCAMLLYFCVLQKS
jgi:hypothetical protein